MTISKAILKKTMVGALAALALSGSVRADDQDQTTARELSKSLGNIPVILASPERGSEKDQCLTQQLQSLAKTLRDMSPEERRQIEEQLRAVGVRSLEIKGSSRANDKKILGERVHLMASKNMFGDKVNFWWDRVRVEGQKTEDAEYFPGFDYAPSSRKTFNFMEKVIVERAKVNQNEFMLNRGNLVIHPRFNAYVLTNKEVEVSKKVYDQIRYLVDLERAIEQGNIYTSETKRHPQSSEFLMACFSPISLGDIVSAVESPVQK
ncbi:MAG: hypothetical protein ACK5QT_09350 [Oligoflexia bacterium]